MTTSYTLQIICNLIEYGRSKCDIGCIAFSVSAMYLLFDKKTATSNVYNGKNRNLLNEKEYIINY